MFNPLRRRDRRLMCVGIGWGRVLCMLDTVGHEWLHLPDRLMGWVCDAHDRRLTRSLGPLADENDLHDKTIRQWWNTSSANTTTLADVKVTYRSKP